ncbi:GDCCVxC domain-containing (seleno)protein [Aliiruegeria sabulilitoris]|uniref:GDCCVxC domain-containing (seleno)protein n=1 Tax=Aliiruegeria sabulilitoris TaxID=1510458 RepID=UPI0009E87D52|nr:GDCCVxC domain-containing (seleno)protein [Aliiruegeria sabulilitoris]NDR57043.1 hypothetical protein [Pseudoruegeria sp. M32A2M]
MTDDDIKLESTITCPEFGYSEIETMPTDSCLWFDECKACRMVLKPLPGDFYVFCSYGTVPCPPVQKGAGCCG